jgi:nucleotide-binding universal stress UspA family protein
VLDLLPHTGAGHGLDRLRHDRVTRGLPLIVIRRPGVRLDLSRSGAIDALRFAVLGCERAAEYLESVTQRWAARGFAASLLALPTGPPAGAILSYARDTRTELIVMTTHGRRGLAGLLLGSVADAVLRHAACPVLLVPADARCSEDHAPSYGQIVVAVDGSAEAERALPHALALAERFEAGVTLVRAVIPVALGTGRGPGPYPRALVADERLEAAVYLADIARRFRRYGVRVRTEPVEGPAAEVLARGARAIPADLVVRPTAQERAWLEHLSMGSVAPGGLRRAPCPVLLVPGAAGPRRSSRRLKTVAKR